MAMSSYNKNDDDNNNTHYYCHLQKLQSSRPPSNQGSLGQGRSGQQGLQYGEGCLDLNPGLATWELCDCGQVTNLPKPPGPCYDSGGNDASSRGCGCRAQCAHWRALQPCLACGRSPSNAGHHHCWPLEPRGPLGQGCHFPTQVGPVHSTRGVFPNRRPAGQGGRSSSGASLLPALEFPGPASWWLSWPLPERQAQPLPQHHAR